MPAWTASRSVRSPPRTPQARACSANWLVSPAYGEAVTTTDWNPVLRGEFDKPYWQQLQQFVRTERDRNRNRIYPPADQVFAALHLTPYADTKVLILGQDPYHGP